MNKIALVIPYFGKFNNYFHLWMESAKCNETVDFHIYTDQPVENFRNIKVHQTTLSEISDLTIRKLSKILEDNNIHNIKVGGQNLLINYVITNLYMDSYLMKTFKIMIFGVIVMSI